MIWQSEAPSNIALIKYMGRKLPRPLLLAPLPAGGGEIAFETLGYEKIAARLPANPSLSYTLEDLTSTVELELNQEIAEDVWTPFFPCAGSRPEGLYHLLLSPSEQTRFLKHLAFLKQQFNFTGHFIVRSRNNFDASCGLASSASSFAALTLCAVKALRVLSPENCPEDLSLAVLANWSRQASGSSCRSFFAPWALWEGESVSSVELPYSKLLHCVILVDRQKKIISSSQAHQLVLTSPLFNQRAERAEERLRQLLQAMGELNWPRMYIIIRDEFLDMHRLFETAEEPFSYKKPGTERVLAYLQNYWDEYGDGPLVTMDAGPNVHLLFRPDQVEMSQELITVCNNIV